MSGCGRDPRRSRNELPHITAATSANPSQTTPQSTPHPHGFPPTNLPKSLTSFPANFHDPAVWNATPHSPQNHAYVPAARLTPTRPTKGPKRGSSMVCGGSKTQHDYITAGLRRIFKMLSKKFCRSSRWRKENSFKLIQLGADDLLYVLSPFFRGDRNFSGGTP